MLPPKKNTYMYVTHQENTYMYFTPQKTLICMLPPKKTLICMLTPQKTLICMLPPKKKPYLYVPSFLSLFFLRFSFSPHDSPSPNITVIFINMYIKTYEPYSFSIFSRN